MLEQRVLSTLNELKDAQWFAECGKPWLGIDRVILVNGWHDAVLSAESAEWENTRTFAANLLRERVIKKDVKRFNRWNALAADIKSAVEDLFQNRIRQAMEKHSVPPALIKQIEWDLIHLLFEAEFADIVSPSFYAGLSYWYCKSRFPCGWQPQSGGSGLPIIY